MDAYAIRAATLDDLDALTDIYNHYIVNTAIGRSESSTHSAESSTSSGMSRGSNVHFG